MNLDLRGRTALVTGAGRGNGRAIALELAELGADVIVNDLDAEPAEETATEIEETGSEAVPLTADVSDEAEVAALVAEGSEALGTVDVLVNNAGVGGTGSIVTGETDALRAEFQRNLAVHICGARSIVR